MNFGFTKIKTITSIVIPAMVGIYFFITMSGLVLDGSTSFTQMAMNKSIFFIISFVLSFVPIYVIWSLFVTIWTSDLFSVKLRPGLLC